MMKELQYILLLLVVLHSVVGPPVDPKKKQHAAKKPDGSQEEINPQLELGIEYNRYLKEVVQALESDESFKKKLETADVNDIKSGKIAKELEFVNHSIRTKLDELKRAELERLRHLAIQEYERNRGVDKKKLKIPSHLDHRNPQTFEIEDLRKLILQTTRDLEEVDRQRKEEFKSYEMEKEYERREKLKEMDDKKAAAAQEEYEKATKKHKEHPKLHHPGSKQQLEEVWQEEDHMRPEDFEPKTFFYMHDLDGNGVWDPDEVKALFQKELDKVYDPNAPEDDMTERVEEMERMREHVFNETDVNKDSLISYAEFLAQTQKEEFERDPGWESLDNQQFYSEQEFAEFQRQRQEELNRLAQMQPPHPGMADGELHEPEAEEHEDAEANQDHEQHQELVETNQIPEGKPAALQPLADKKVKAEHIPQQQKISNEIPQAHQAHDSVQKQQHKP